MSQLFNRAFEISQAQARAAGQAAQIVANCVTSLLEASAQFAKTSASRNADFAATIMSARSHDAAIDMHNAFAQDSVRATAAMATKIADTCSAAAMECAALAAAVGSPAPAPAAPKKV